MRIGEKLGQEVSKDKGSAGFCNTRGYGSPTGRVTFTQVPKYSRMYSVIEALLTIICLLLFNIYRFDIKFFFFFGLYIALLGLSLVAVSRGCSLVVVLRLLIAVASLGEHRI